MSQLNVDLSRFVNFALKINGDEKLTAVRILPTESQRILGADSGSGLGSSTPEGGGG